MFLVEWLEYRVGRSANIQIEQNMLGLSDIFDEEKPDYEHERKAEK